MTARTPADNRLLLDATQVAIAVGALLALALTWWVVFDEDGGDDHLRSGWGGLDSGTYGLGWLLIVGVGVAMVAVLTDHRLVRIGAAVVSGVATLWLLFALVTIDDFAGYEASNGPWIGFALLLATTITQGLAAYTSE